MPFDAYHLFQRVDGIGFFPHLSLSFFSSFHENYTWWIGELVIFYTEKTRKVEQEYIFFVKSFFGKIQEILILLITSGVFFSYFYRKEPRHRKPLEEFIPILKRVSSWPNVWITTISKKTGRRLRQKLPENIVKMGEITLLKMVTSYFSNLTQVPDWLLEKRNRPPRFLLFLKWFFSREINVPPLK